MNKPLDSQTRRQVKMLANPADRKRKASTSRIDPIAVLPVFWKLKGQNALVVGATDAAAWKAELLAAAGANVTVIGTGYCAVLDALCARDLRSGSIVHLDRDWCSDDLTDQSMVIADLEDQAEIQSLIAAAKGRAVPYNVIDKPEYCQFQFGSIVNRSPVVIGISTNGAAPILGQNIRRRIEAVIPNSLKNWAQFAAAIRNGVNKHLSPGQERRAFWENLSKDAFGQELSRAYRKQTRQRLGDISNTDRPPSAPREIQLKSNDVEDLTLRQVRWLQSAHCIAYDKNVSVKILEMARREATRIPIEQAGSQACDLVLKLDETNVSGLDRNRERA